MLSDEWYFSSYLVDTFGIHRSLIQQSCSASISREPAPTLPILITQEFLILMAVLLVVMRILVKEQRYRMEIVPALISVQVLCGWLKGEVKKSKYCITSILAS